MRANPVCSAESLVTSGQQLTYTQTARMTGLHTKHACLRSPDTYPSQAGERTSGCRQLRTIAFRQCCLWLRLAMFRPDGAADRRRQARRGLQCNCCAQRKTQGLPGGRLVAKKLQRGKLDQLKWQTISARDKSASAQLPALKAAIPQPPSTRRTSQGCCNCCRRYSPLAKLHQYRRSTFVCCWQCNVLATFLIVSRWATSLTALGCICTA